VLVAYSAYSLNLKMEAVQSSETLVNQFTWHHISEYDTVHIQHCENNSNNGVNGYSELRGLTIKFASCHCVLAMVAFHSCIVVDLWQSLSE
jgi:hypothetical protein